MEHNDIKLEHINRSLLHLNKYGDCIIADKFLTVLKEWLFDNNNNNNKIIEIENNNEVPLEGAGTLHSNLCEFYTTSAPSFNGSDIYIIIYM